MRGALLEVALVTALATGLAGQQRLNADTAGPPLHLAAKTADTTALRQLLAGGADPNAYDEFGYTPLLWAAYRENAFPFAPANTPRYEAAVVLLLQHGATADLPKRDGLPIFMTAGPSLNQGASALRLAAGACAEGLVARLLESGADPDLADGSGLTPLAAASATGCPDAVRLLLAAHDRLGHPREPLTAALTSAAARKLFYLDHLKVVGLLLEAGADPTQPIGRLRDILKTSRRSSPVQGRIYAERILTAMEARSAGR